MTRLARLIALVPVLAVPVLAATVLAGAVLAAVVLPPPSPASAGGYEPINGAGSTWSQNALDQWRHAVAGRGILVNFAGTGSTDGRDEFGAGLTDFAVSEIPFQSGPGHGVAPEHPARGYAYVPVVAGGTALMYHLSVGGHRVENLRLSGSSIAKIFTGAIWRWDDPQLRSENPGLSLPDEPITPVVRADSAGTTAQFTSWLAGTQTALWQSYCDRTGLAEPCGATSTYPITGGMRAQSGSLGVADYVAQSYGEGAIGYVETSYAKLAGYPVASVLNPAGYYVQPSASAVAVGLLKARTDTDRASPDYLIQQLDGVYTDPDPRSYPLSSYSYLIVPTTTADGFTAARGATLAAFGEYALCQGQRGVAGLGYSPLPVNLVRAGLAQLTRIPGASPRARGVAGCGNPTFSASGVNTLAATAPFPPACAWRDSASQCGSTGTASTSNGSGGSTGGPAAGATAGPAGPANGIAGQPVTVPVAGGWSQAQTIMVAVFGAALAALLVPVALAARRRRGRRDRQSTPMHLPNASP